MEKFFINLNLELLLLSIYIEVLMLHLLLTLHMIPILKIPEDQIEKRKHSHKRSSRQQSHDSYMIALQNMQQLMDENIKKGTFLKDNLFPQLNKT
jgi:hypothetical protein